MKFYLLAGGLLLTGASVYGVTDYVKTKNNKAFQELYKEAPVVQATDVKISDIREDDYSRGKMEAFTPAQRMSDKAGLASTVNAKAAKTPMRKNSEDASLKRTPVSAEPNPSLTEPELKTANAPAEKRKSLKKITMKKFSRAPLKEEVILEETKN